MDLEQKAPNRPNFKLIFGLFAASVVLLLIAAVFFMRHESSKLPSGEPNRHASLLRLSEPAGSHV